MTHYVTWYPVPSQAAPAGVPTPTEASNADGTEQPVVEIEVEVAEDSTNSEPDEDTLAVVEAMEAAPEEEADQQQEMTARIADMPWSKMDGFIIPMAARETRETLPTILDLILIEQLRLADAPSHLAGYFAGGHTFHQASELEVGNYILALTAVLMAPHVATIHSSELKAGRYIEAWISLARKDASLLETQQKFVRLAKIIHKLCQPMRQSPVLYQLLNWRRGSQHCLDVLAQLAELGDTMLQQQACTTTPELASHAHRVNQAIHKQWPRQAHRACATPSATRAGKSPTTANAHGGGWTAGDGAGKHRIRGPAGPSSGRRSHW